MTLFTLPAIVLLRFSSDPLIRTERSIRRPGPIWHRLVTTVVPCRRAARMNALIHTDPRALLRRGTPFLVCSSKFSQHAQGGVRSDPSRSTSTVHSQDERSSHYV